MNPGPCRILVCALDWGLGHATRSSVLVRRWLDQGASVTLAGNGGSLDFWRKEFPDLPVRELPDYAVRYAPGAMLVPRLLMDVPRLLRVRWAESALVASWADEFDLVVSDNRFGCHIPGKPSWFLTHQLHLAAPRGFGFAESLGEVLMAIALRAFTGVLIPDGPSRDGLSGPLGHPRYPGLFPPLQWIGPLSRFEGLPAAPSAWAGPWDSLCLVSGPEPARTSFENELVRSLEGKPGRHLLVQGLPGREIPPSPSVQEGVQRVGHLPTADLAAALANAKAIATRGGYSTLMDLEALHCLDHRCLLVPTPGQTEQEFLADDLSTRRGVRTARSGRIPTDWTDGVRAG